MCTTTIYGEGGNCATGAGGGNWGYYSFAGYWVPVSHSVCGHTWTSLAKDGIKHPNANFFSFKTATFTYSGCDDARLGKCDCLNGGCVPASTYGTPGKYATLSACQSGCAKDSTCSGECVSAAEIAALQQAANNLQSRICS
jgi:hypothetical protein